MPDTETTDNPAERPAPPPTPTSVPERATPPAEPDLVLDPDELLPLDLDAVLGGDGRDPDRRDPLARIRSNRLPGADLIVLIAVEAALPRVLLRDLSRGRPVAAVITVPSPAWYRPLTDLINRLSDGRAAVVEAAARLKSGPHAPETEAARALCNGRPVIGLATSLELLPAVLTAAADHRAALPPPGPEVMVEAIRRWCPRARRITLVPEALAGLDLTDLAAALRPQSTPRACRERLERASRARLGPAAGPPPPPLVDLAVTGPSRDWALGLVADIDRVRAGALPASALEGAVFCGPPGTGKTLLARSIAAEARVPFLETSVGTWFATTNGYLDGVIKGIDAFCDGLLQAARADVTAIGFLDELDGLPSRDNLSQRGRDWWTSVINHALLRIQALREAGVVLLAATNHLDNLDAALLRPGRFDRTFWIGPPDEAARIAILRAHLGTDLADADLGPAARLASGATGAVLAGHVKAARAAARASGRPLALADLLGAIAPPDPRPPAELRRVALHEAAHAVVAHRLGLPVLEVTIRACGAAAGMTVLGEADPMPDRGALERQVVGLLAGRAADLDLGGGAHAGAHRDLRAATRVVCAIEAAFGLGTRLLHRADPDACEALLRADPALAARIEAGLRRLMRQARALVTAERRAIEATVEALLERRCLTGEEIAVIAAAHRSDCACAAQPIRRRSASPNTPRPGRGSPDTDGA